MEKLPLKLLGDNPVVGPDQDRLGFLRFVEPFADRIIASRAHAPFTVGIHAPWGQGKSTVMALLRDVLARKAIQSQPSVVLRSAFFYPWKYHTREEVWRGLILTLVGEIKARDNWWTELKRRWKANEKNWLELLAGVAGALANVPGFKAGTLVKAVGNEPWSPEHLHRFEAVIRDRFADLNGRRRSAGDRLFVLFVDDLDRCLPEPAAAVLEALKLVLNQPGLVTVLGVDDKELARAVRSLYRRALGEEGETLAKAQAGGIDWGRDYLRKIVQIPLHLPMVSDRALDDYVAHCLLDGGVGPWLVTEDEELRLALDCRRSGASEAKAKSRALPRPLTEYPLESLEQRLERWAKVLRETCGGNLRQVKRFLNRFVAEWDKANAGAKDIRPTGVALILLLDRRHPAFLRHCLDGASLERYMNYQKWFLKSRPTERGGPEAEEPAKPASTVEEFLDDSQLGDLFRELMVPVEPDPDPMVPEFRGWWEFNRYVRFGRLDEPEPETEVAEESAGQVETPEAKQKVAKKRPVRKRTVAKKQQEKKNAPAGKPPEAVPEQERAPHGMTDPETQERLARFLSDAQKALSAERYEQVEKYAQEGIGIARSVGAMESAVGLLEVMAEGWLQSGRPEKFEKTVVHQIETLWQDSTQPNRLPLEHARSERLRGRLRNRVRELLEDEKRAEQLGGLAAWRKVEQEIADPRPGVGLDPETGLPRLAWVPIRGVDGLKLGDGLRAEDNEEFRQDNERWDGADTLQLEPYLLAAYPVTVAQFRPFVEQDGYSNAEYWTQDGWSWREQEKRTQPDRWGNPDYALDNNPVVGVAWYEAVAWCHWLTARLRERGLLPANMLIRLPTEAEWEWAVRGPEGQRWPWGDDWPNEEILCNSEEAGLEGTSAVGLFAPNRSDVLDPEPVLPVPGERAEGLFDQAGNVWEWCATNWQEKYPLPVANEWSDDYLAGAHGRVLRGGSWYNDRAGVRGACRYRDYPGGGDDGRGFRCCAATSSR